MLRLFVVLVGLACSGFGQNQKATVEGYVMDGQRLGVAQATVVLETSQGAAVRKTVSDAAGRYQFTGVDAGSYKLRFSASGFETYTEGPLTLTSGQKLTDRKSVV